MRIPIYFVCGLESQKFHALIALILQIFFNYIGSAEGHEYPDLQVGDEVNPRPVFMFS